MDSVRLKPCRLVSILRGEGKGSWHTFERADSTYEAHAKVIEDFVLVEKCRVHGLRTFSRGKGVRGPSGVSSYHATALDLVPRGLHILERRAAA